MSSFVSKRLLLLIIYGELYVIQFYIVKFNVEAKKKRYISNWENMFSTFEYVQSLAVFV